MKSSAPLEARRVRKSARAILITTMMPIVDRPYDLGTPLVSRVGGCTVTSEECGKKGK